MPANQSEVYPKPVFMVANTAPESVPGQRPGFVSVEIAEEVLDTVGQQAKSGKAGSIRFVFWWTKIREKLKLELKQLLFAEICGKN